MTRGGGRVILRCAYCAYSPIHDLASLSDHESRCAIRVLRQAEWQRQVQRHDAMVALVEQLSRESIIYSEGVKL